VNVVNQKKQQDNNMMIMTQYNSNPKSGMGASFNTAVVTRAIAHQKVKKYRNQGRSSDSNDNSNTHLPEANSTQDEFHMRKTSIGQNPLHATHFQNKKTDQNNFTIYKAKRQVKMNQFSGRQDENQSFDYSHPMGNASLLVPDNQQMANNSFTSGPSTTASRFYNANKHNRFLSNFNTHKNTNAPVFQNNFVLPMALNSSNVNKTFYNSKQQTQTILAQK
jgi:hypothetical protein